VRLPPLLVLLALAFHGTSAQAPLARTLAGVVTDTARRPIPGVEVGVLDGKVIARNMRTGDNGRFEFRYVPRGKVSVMVRRLGFQPRVYTVQIREGATRAFLPVVLEPMPAELEKVIVMARVAESGGRLKDFYERMSRNPWGSYVDREQIERRNPTWTSDMLRMVPGVQVLSTRFGHNAVRLRGCRPTVWLDGVALRNVEVDEIVFPFDIAGIEVYRSSAGMPPEFNDLTGCGAIIVWTRLR
jgi:hypothetical protein